MKTLLLILLVVGFAVGYNALLVTKGPAIRNAIISR